MVPLLWLSTDQHSWTDSAAACSVCCQQLCRLVGLHAFLVLDDAELEWPEDAPLQPHKGDYRDVIPPTFEEVVEVYRCA